MIDVLNALLTPVIAITTTYIAYQQYRLRRDERATAIYERRLNIYRNAISILDRVRAGNPLTTEEVFSWETSMAETPFLFGREVEPVINALFSALYAYAVESEPEANGKASTIDSAKLAIAVEDWRTPLVEVFSPYLCQTGSTRVKHRLSVKQVNKLVSEISSDKELDKNTDVLVDTDIPF
jgi:hypothetical protein